MIAAGLIWNYRRGETQREINKFKMYVAQYDEVGRYIGRKGE